MVQMQSKDMASRFSKKGKVNADEVQLLEYKAKALFCCGLLSFVCVGVWGLLDFMIHQLPHLYPFRSA